MDDNPDRRVRRTRAALRDALLDLMGERGYPAVTVHDIIERADVGRSTFYNHYTDKDDLLRDGLAGLQAIISEPAAPAGGGRRWLQFSLPLLTHLHQQRRQVRALLVHPSGPVLEEVERVLTEVVRAELDRLPPDRAPRVPPAALVRAVVSAYLGLVQWWLEEEPRLLPEDADRVFHALIAPTLRAATGPERPAG